MNFAIESSATRTIKIPDDFVRRYAEDLTQYFVHREESEKDVAESLARMYFRLGLEPPLILWSKNIFGFGGLPWFRPMAAQVPEPSWKQGLINKIQGSFRNEHREQLQDFWSSMERLKELDYPESLGRSISTQLNHEVYKQFPPRLADAAERLLGVDGKLELDELLKELLVGFLSASQARPRRTPAGRGFLHEQRYTQTEKVERSSWTPVVLSWLLTFDCLRKFEPDAFSEELNVWLTDWIILMWSAKSFSLTENVAFMTSRPQAMTMDENHRLHNETGPAYITCSGDEYHYWHGAFIEKKLFERRSSLRIKDIDAERNIEVRRALLDMYGMEKYFRNSRLKKIHSDEFGILYRKDIPNDEPMVVVNVKNSTAEPDGSFRDYMLRVPPDTVTARQGIAWSFGMTESEYAPDQET